MRSGTDPELRAAVITVLGSEALSGAELRARLGPPWDRPVGRDDLDRLLQTDTSFLETSAGFVAVAAFLDGTAWTVHVDADEGADGFVRMHPDLDTLGWWLVGGDVALIDAAGNRIGLLETEAFEFDGEDSDVVLGPDGWLAELLGGWARVEVIGGALRWTPLAEPPPPTDAQVAAVRAGFERAVDAADENRLDHSLPMPEGLRFVNGASAVEEAVLIDAAAFRTDPIPPLADLYAAAGLVQRNSTVAGEGFEWETLRAWQERNRLALMHALTPEQADALATVVDRIEAAVGGAADLVLAPLDDGAVAAAAWDELLRRAVPLDALANTIGAAEPATSVGAGWLHARLLDRAGDVAAAVAVLDAVVTSECRHEPALVDLAGFRADRGDAGGAVRLLVQAGVAPDEGEDDDEYDDDEYDDGDLDDRGRMLWREVEGPASHRPRPTARRNDPCPCGSGRKYKVCHLGREAHSLDDRAPWLFNKACRFRRDRHPYDVEELAGTIVDEFRDGQTFDALIDGPFLEDVVLHEDGVFAAFLAARDGLLPADEVLLGAQWALVDRSVFEVLDIGGSHLDLRDLVSGERIRVVNVQPSGFTRPGMVVVGRPLPVGDTYRAFSGFIPVNPVHQAAMLAAIDDGSSDALAEVLASMLAPAALTNTDGDVLDLVTMTWRVPRPGEVATALAEAGFTSDDEDRWTLLRDDQTVIASIELDGDELIGDVNSAERADQLQRIIAGALPGAELVDIEETELPDRPAPLTELRSGESQDPAMRAALAEFILDYERRWLDESIPALGGRTPREAAADPIGREELLRLLASFPEPPAGDLSAMDPERLRAALGM